jgi:catechol-2,3-dioxygenase
MKLTGVMHTGFTVSDIDRSIHFYRDTLGMQLVRRQEGTAPYLEGAYAIYLRDPDGFTIELYQPAAT